MTILQNGILLLLKSAILNQSYPLPDTFSLEEAASLLHSHQIQSLGYQGALLCGIDKSTPVMRSLFRSYCANTLISERQMDAVQKIYTAFDEAGIDYMPVKGCNMKLLYPAPALRCMGDADILIRLEQYPSIVSIMQSLHFTQGDESDHEFIWDSSALHVELHKRLMPSYTPDYFQYYGNGWHLAKLHEGSHYYMTPEDELIYLFTHFAKHYRLSGIGLRQTLDLWIYQLHHPTLDWNYMQKQLRCLHLADFFQNIQQLLRVWFEDAPMDPLSEQITQYIFANGSWGTCTQWMMSSTAELASANHSLKSGRRQWLLHTLFPPLSVLQYKYPYLKHYPFLLPFGWGQRILSTCIWNPARINGYLRRLRALSYSNIADREQQLKLVGLQFNFEDHSPEN